MKCVWENSTELKSTGSQERHWTLLEQQRDAKKELLTQRESYAKTQEMNSIWVKALNGTGSHVEG